MREVARRAYLAGYKDGSPSRRQEGDVDIPVGYVRNVSVEAYCAHMNYSPRALIGSEYIQLKYADFRRDYNSFADLIGGRKAIAAELRRLGYYVENIGGRIQVDVWVGGTIVDESEENIKELPF